MKDCLLIVDVQNDFCPGGTLGTRDGHKIIPVINELMNEFPMVVASKDWHPTTSVHFDKWPVHCVRSSEGAAFPSTLDFQKIQKVFLKGTGNTDDGYSAFEATNDDLDFFLQQQGVTSIYICGIATEYCVMATASDAVRKGFKVFLLTDAISGVELKAGDSEKALNDMKKMGITAIQSNQVMLEKGSRIA